MAKKHWRSATFTLAVVAAVATAMAVDFKSRNDALHSLWQNMCLDNNLDQPSCEDAWSRAQHRN